MISTSDAHPGILPDGFFRVRNMAGKITLGYSDRSISWYCLNVGRTVNAGGRMVTLDPKIKIEDLPLIQLTARRELPGVATVGGKNIVDTDMLDSFSGDVEYFRDDGQRHQPLKDDLSNGLWGGGH
jgi:hypothetical protein